MGRTGYPRMTVYVDRAQHQLGRMKMSHLLADSLDELHAMADKIGLKREWFQTRSTPHYDVCQAKRAEAIKHGAVEVGNRELVTIIRKWREQR